MDPEPLEIIREIHAAFGEVPRGPMSIREADVVDAYGSQAEREAARNLDTDTHWSEMRHYNYRTWRRGIRIAKAGLRASRGWILKWPDQKGPDAE